MKEATLVEGVTGQTTHAWKTRVITISKNLCGTHLYPWTLGQLRALEDHVLELGRLYTFQKRVWIRGYTALQLTVFLFLTGKSCTVDLEKKNGTCHGNKNSPWAFQNT